MACNILTFRDGNCRWRVEHGLSMVRRDETLVRRMCQMGSGYV